MKALAVANLLVLAPLGAGAFSLTARPTLTRQSIGPLNVAASPESFPENPFTGFLDKLKSASPYKAKEQEVVIDPDYKLAWVFGAAALWIYLFYPDKACFDPEVTQICFPSFFPAVSAFLHLWFGLFLADRASRIRIIFDDKHFQMKDVYNNESLLSPKVSKELDVMGEREMNYVVGGMNKWSYDKFVNWDFFPSVHMPILVYFKETQTSPDKWVVGPGRYDRRRNGMVHFFPAFGSSYQIKEQFEARGLSKIKK